MLDILLDARFARSLRPFNLGNDQAFEYFVSTIAPRNRLPTTQTVRKHVGVMFVQCKVLIKGYIAPRGSDEGFGPACCLTACLQTAWAGRNDRSYNGTLANMQNDDFRPRLVCLDMVKCLIKHHTAAMITEMLAKTIEHFNIPHAAIFGTVLDTRSNVKEGA